MRIAIWIGGSKGHPFGKVRDSLIQLINSIPDMSCEVHGTQELLEPDILSRCDAIVSYTQGGDLTREQEDVLFSFVSAGKGFVGIHGATASFKQNPRYHQFIGGRFTGHGFPTKIATTIIDTSHPVTKGLDSIVLKDEPYNHELLGDIHVLIERREKDRNEPMAWVKYHGKGRIVYIAFGHFAKNFKHEGMQILLKQSLAWVTQKGGS